MAAFVGSENCKTTATDAPAGSEPEDTRIYGLPETVPVAFDNVAFELRLSSTRYTGPRTTFDVTFCMETCCTNACVRRSRTKPPRVTVSVGGVRSMVHANVAGEASTLPAASIARTANEWRPSASAEYVT